MSDQVTPASGAPMSRRELEAKIVAKAWRDPAYKKQLMENPHAVLQAELSQIDPSIVLPASLQIHVHEETPNDYHLVLPRNPRDISLGEVLGDNLEALAPQTIVIITATNNTTVVGALQVTNVNTNIVGNVVGNVVGVNNFNVQTVGNVAVVGNLVVVSGVSPVAVTNVGTASSWATIATGVNLTNAAANAVA